MSNSNNYGNLDDINEKIQNKLTPNEKDKELLLYRLNKLLNDDEHLYIFTEILQTLEKRIYSITENCTLFDLNDLPNDAFWKIYYYTQLFILDHERQKELGKIQKEQQSKNDEFKEDINTKLQKYKNDPNQATPENIEQLSAYEKLRLNALSQCSYSTYSHNNTNTDDFNLSLPDDKILAKTIYSDNFKYKWKQENKIDQNKINLKKQTESDTQLNCVNYSDVGDYEIDDDDMMLNENYSDNEDDELGREREKEELDRLKNQLLKLPKMKLTLKVTPMNYDEMEDDE